MEKTISKKTGRPTKYDDTILDKTQDYINSCVDEYDEFHKTRSDNSNGYDRLVKVNLPSVAGLAVYLRVSKSTIWLWAKDYPDFSDALDEIAVLQEKRLVDGGMSGEYNSTIAKLVLATNHNYREKSDVTSDNEKLQAGVIILPSKNDTEPTE